MDSDVTRARASFMTRASDLRDKLHFADPHQKMKAMQLYTCDAYGSMLWDFTDSCTGRYFRAWNIQSRHMWNIHPQTHCNLIENYFCKDFIPLRNQVYGRYPKFIWKLKSSPSKEVRFMINFVETDPRSKPCLNIRHLSDITNEDCLAMAPWRWKQLLPKLELDSDSWRISWLDCLLDIRQSKSHQKLNITEDQFDQMFTSLCIS